jgi:hypothetical protein
LVASNLTPDRLDDADAAADPAAAFRFVPISLAIDRPSKRRRATPEGAARKSASVSPLPREGAPN